MPSEIAKRQSVVDLLHTETCSKDIAAIVGVSLATVYNVRTKFKVTGNIEEVSGSPSSQQNTDTGLYQGRGGHNQSGLNSLNVEAHQIQRRK